MPLIPFFLFGTPTGNRTPDSAVRGLRLNRLTMRACQKKLLNCSFPVPTGRQLRNQRLLRWTMLVKVSPSKGVRTPDSAVRGLRLNRLTMRARQSKLHSQLFCQVKTVKSFRCSSFPQKFLRQFLWVI